MTGRKHNYCIYLNARERKEFRHLSLSQAAPHSEVLRARIILLSSDHPEWTIEQIADEAGCKRSTVIKFRHRWVFEGSIKDHPRPGAPRIYQASVRARITALACTRPKDHGKPWQRWSSYKLAQVAHEEGISSSISPGTVNRLMKQERIKPWRYHLWQKSTDPEFVEKASPILDLYQKAHSLGKKR